MIDLQSLEEDIAGLEAQTPSYPVMERLAWLYTVKDHIEAAGKKSGEFAPELSGSEFLQSCSGASLTSLFAILDEHMEAIKIIHPKEYATLIQRIQLLKSI